MNPSFLQTKLGEVLHLNIDAIPVDPAATYQIAGVYSFARGLLTRAPLQGAATTYKVMHRLHKDHFVDYCNQGKRSYFIASTFAGDPYREEAPVLRRLSEQFELCAYGLSQVRREWEQAKAKK